MFDASTKSSFGSGRVGVPSDYAGLCPPAFEQCEPRILLSGDVIFMGWEGVGVLDANGRPQVAKSEWQVRMDSPTTYDAGDYYAYFDEKMPIVRVVDEVVVGLASDGREDAEDLARKLTAEGGLLEGFDLFRWINADLGIANFVAPAVEGFDVEATVGRVQSSADVIWAGPAFCIVETHGRMWVTDEIIVSLGSTPGDDFDGAAFMDEQGFSAYRPSFGFSDHQYVATVPGGPLVPLAISSDTP